MTNRRNLLRLSRATRALVNQVNEGIEPETQHEVKVLAQKILDARKNNALAEAEEAIEKDKLLEAELENARRATLTPPGTAISLTVLKRAVTTKATLLGKRKEYYKLLLEKAKRIYPQYFL